MKKKSEEEDGGDLQVDEKVEERRSPVRIPAPCRPSKQEIEEHELTHTPFRPWCRCCVKGRANKKPSCEEEQGGEKDGEWSGKDGNGLFLHEQGRGGGK